MSIYDSLGSNGGQQRQQMTPQEAMRQLRANPAAALKQAGLNIPAGLNNPQAIINHLLQSGQIPQARYARALQISSITSAASRSFWSSTTRQV